MKSLGSHSLGTQEEIKGVISNQESFFYYYLFSEQGPYVVQATRKVKIAKAGLQFQIFLPPKCWDYRCIPPQQARILFLTLL